MSDSDHPFWEKKPLSDMTLKEWESICDGCGICCLEKLEYEDTGEVEYTSVSCRYLETHHCRCEVYNDRFSSAPDCLTITPENVILLTWLPDTCAYRILSEGKKLMWWHPLVSGDPETVHQAGISVRGRVIPGKFVHPDDIEGYII